MYFMMLKCVAAEGGKQWQAKEHHRINGRPPSAKWGTTSLLFLIHMEGILESVGMGFRVA